MKYLLIISLFSLASCKKESLAPSSVNAQSTSAATISEKGKESFPMEYLAWNECTNEWVVVSLVIEYKFNYFVTKDDFHAKALYQIKNGSGAGVTSGNTYRLVGHTLDIEKQMNYQATDNETFRVTSKLTFINPNGKDWVSESIRIRKVQDDGTVTLDVEEENSYCR